jgi:hypothetical protein
MHTCAHTHLPGAAHKTPRLSQQTRKREGRVCVERGKGRVGGGEAAGKRAAHPPRPLHPR